MRILNKAISRVLPLAAGALTMMSCSDFLDKEPDERVQITTPEQVSSLLITSYPSANYGPICELSGDNLIDNNVPHYDEESKKMVYYNLKAFDRRDEEIFRFEPVKSAEDTDSPTMLWEGYYSSIASVNHALQALEEIKNNRGGEMDDRMKAAYGEALLIRAYDHFCLVNLFCQAYKNPELSKQDIGIPYITKVGDIVHENESRGNVADVYDKIQADLEEGLKYVSDTYYAKPKYRFNVSAAHAFAARFYLFRRDYNKVIEHADFVLGTDRSQLPQKLMKYDHFTKCVNGDDFANQWQSPEDPNNIMLISTYSLAARHLSGGVRFACNATAAKQTIMRTGPTWHWTIIPCAFVSGLFTNGSQDYGLFQGKVIERFEYSDKISGIGYPHTIRREFTNTQLLLERAEALLLSPDRRDVAMAFEDLKAYEKSRQSLDEENYKYFASDGSIEDLTEDIIKRYYTYMPYAKEQNPGVVENYNFTQNMSPDFVIPDDVALYFNCLMDFRRYETLFDGGRWFDLKRFGMDVTHEYRDDDKSVKTITLSWNDKRRAFELPQKVLSAGLPSSYSKPDTAK